MHHCSWNFCLCGEREACLWDWGASFCRKRCWRQKKMLERSKEQRPQRAAPRMPRRNRSPWPWVRRTGQEWEMSFEGVFCVPHTLSVVLPGESHELTSRCQRNFSGAETPALLCTLCFSYAREVQGQGEVTVWASMWLLQFPVPRSREKTEPEHVLPVGVYMYVHTHKHRVHECPSAPPTLSAAFRGAWETLILQASALLLPLFSFLCWKNRVSSPFRDTVFPWFGYILSSQQNQKEL